MLLNKVSKYLYFTVQGVFNKKNKKKLDHFVFSSSRDICKITYKIVLKRSSYHGWIHDQGVAKELDGEIEGG
jgi:hypothetical protein